MDFDIQSTEGKAITDYTTLKSLVTFSNTNGTFNWDKQKDGSAKLYYTPTAFNNDAGNAKETKVCTEIIYGNASNVTKQVIQTSNYTVNEARAPKSVVGITKDVATAVSSDGTSTITLKPSQVIIEDQYDNPMSADEADAQAANIHVMVAAGAASGFAGAADTTLNALSGSSYHIATAGTVKDTTTVYLKYANAAVTASNADYSFQISSVDSTKATNLAIASVVNDADGYIVKDAVASALAAANIKVTGTIGGKTVVIPSTQYVVTGNTYAAFEEGKTGVKTANVEVTVDTADGPVVLTKEYTWSNEDAALKYVTAKKTAVTASQGSDVTKDDLVKGFDLVDQYGEVVATDASNAIKYNVEGKSGTIGSIIHNNTNAVVVEHTGAVTLFVTATLGDQTAEKEISITTA